MGKEMQVVSESQRRLQELSFQPSTLMTRDLPRDTCLKFLQLRLSGSIVTTFGSGTPVADAFSTFSNLIARIDVIINGSVTVKSVMPWFMRMQQLFAQKIQSERKSSAGAAAVINPTADAAFTYGTTTQTTSVAESILIPFENIMCSEGAETTWLNLKGVSSAEIRITTNAYSSLLGFGNTAPVVYSASTLSLAITTVEAQNVPAEYYFSLWKQTTKQVAFSAQVTENLVEISRGNFLQGIMFLARDGAAGGATSATGKLANNLALTDIKLLINGQRIIKSTNFLELQAENRSRFGINAPYASDVSVIDGVCYLDLLAKGKIQTALDIRPPLVDQCHVSLSTRAAASVTYTNNVDVYIMTNEIVRPS